MEENKNKRIPKLTIIAIVLMLVNIGTFIFFLTSVFSSLGNFRVALVVEVIVTVISIVFACEARKENKIGLLIPVFVLDILIVVAMPLPTILGFIFDSSSENHENIRKRVDQEATVEYIKSLIRHSEVYLPSNSQYEKEFTYRDYSGTITNKFKQLDFSKASYDSSIKYDIEFYRDDCHYVSFSSDYTSLKVYAENTVRKLSYEYGRQNYYSLNQTDADAFKELVRNEVNTQRETCLAKQEETKANLTWEKMIEIFKSGNYPQVCISKMGGNQLYGGGTDYNREILWCLDEIFASGITKTSYDGNNTYTKTDLDYGWKNSEYRIYVIENENLLVFHGMYTCYERTYSEYEVFQLTAEQTNHIMTVARSLFSE